MLAFVLLTTQRFVQGNMFIYVIVKLVKKNYY